MSVRSPNVGVALCVVITVLTFGPVEVFACPYTDCTVCDEDGNNCRPLIEDPFNPESMEADAATSLGTAAAAAAGVPNVALIKACKPYKACKLAAGGALVSVGWPSGIHTLFLVPTMKCFVCKRFFLPNMLS